MYRKITSHHIFKRILIFLVILFIVAGLIVGGIMYKNYENKKEQKKRTSNTSNTPRNIIRSPVYGMSLQEAVASFNESFLYYLLNNIGVSSLHNAPFSSNTPKMILYVSDDIYNAEIIDKKIKIKKGLIEGEDIIIRTTKEEAIKMIKDKTYIKQSFSDGNSGVELVAGKTELVMKGYWDIYETLS